MFGLIFNEIWTFYISNNDQGIKYFVVKLQNSYLDIETFHYFFNIITNKIEAYVYMKIR